MPVTISVTHDFDAMERKLGALGLQQLPYACARALTDTAKAARVKISADMGQIFDNPVPFTVNALGFTSATKQSLCAVVFVKDVQAKYLLHEEIGGERSPAENTNKPAQALIVPSKIKLNSFGNIPNAAVKKLFQAVALGGAQQARAAKGKKKGQSIAYLQGHGLQGQGAGGLFLRLPDHHIRRLLSFEGSASYRPRFHFGQRVRFVALTTFGPALWKRLAEARAAGPP